MADKEAGQVWKRRDYWGQWQSGEPVLPHKSGQQLCSSGSSRPYGGECTARVAKRDLSRETENTAISVKYDFQMLQTNYFSNKKSEAASLQSLLY